MILVHYCKEGRNDIVLWLGHGWYSKGLPGVDYDRPLVRAQAEQLKGDSGKPFSGPIQPGAEGTAVIPGLAPGDRVTMAVKKLMPLSFFRILAASSLDAAAWSPCLTVQMTSAGEATPQTTEMNSIREDNKSRYCNSFRRWQMAYRYG